MSNNDHDSTDPATETPDLPNGVTEFPAADATPAPRLSAFERAELRVMVPIALVILILVAALIAFQASRDTTGTTTTISSTPTGVTAGYGVVHGSPDAPVDVVVYEDFLCPACLNFEQAHGSNIALLVEKDVISVEYRILSFLDRASTTNYSTRAMNAYLAVRVDTDAETAEKFRQTLYLNQPAEGGPGLSDEDLAEIAANVGADRDAIAAAQADLRYEQWIVNANDAASKDGANQTPTVLVDGDALENPFTDFVPAVLDAAKAAGVDTDALTGDPATGGDGDPSNDTGTDTDTDTGTSPQPTPGTQQPKENSK